MEPPKEQCLLPILCRERGTCLGCGHCESCGHAPDPNITTTTTSLSTSHTTNGHVEGEGLSRENSEDNGPISDPSPAMFCNCPPDPALDERVTAIHQVILIAKVGVGRRCGCVCACKCSCGSGGEGGGRECDIPT